MASPIVVQVQGFEPRRVYPGLDGPDATAWVMSILKHSEFAASGSRNFENMIPGFVLLALLAGLFGGELPPA